MMEVCYLTEIDRLLNVAASIKLRHKGLSLENCLQAKPLGAPKGPFFVSGGCCTSTYKCGRLVLDFVFYTFQLLILPNMKQDIKGFNN